MSGRTELLDPADAAQLTAYERAFHAAFCKVTSNRLVRTLWRWDDEGGRLATRIPYEDQIVYLRRKADGAINWAVAVNVARHDFQGRAFGFAPDPKETWAEILTFFAAYEKSATRSVALVSDVLHDLARRGFTACYATTAARPLRAYTRYFGMEVVRRGEIDGEVRYFLRYPLPPPYFQTHGAPGAALG